MKMRKILALLLVFTLILGTTSVYAADSSSATDEIPYTDFSGKFSASYVSTVAAYSAEEASVAGIPDGYSGYVLRAQPSADPGYAACELDFSSQKIPTADIESITFRVYLPTGHTEMRLLGEKAPTTWIMRKAPANYSAWCDITLSADGTNFQSGKTFADLANSEGYLGRMCLIGRMGSSSDKSYYLDSINIKYKSGVSDDTTPPVITYNGDTELTAYAGERFALSGISAYDNEDKTNAIISYEWSDGAVDSEGRLKEGTHICTVKATDRSGNTSSITVSVNVKVDDSLVILDSVPFCGYIDGVSIYDATVTDLDFNTATSAGVPAGFSGNVLEVKGTSARFGMTFDPSALGIPVGLIDRITFRFYLRESTNAIRMSNHGASNWDVLANATAGVWMEYTIGADGSGMSNGYKIADFANDDGMLGVFGIGTKYESTNNYTFYIDYVEIKLKEDDGAAPVLSYDGETDILTSSGKPFVIGISARDELEGRDIALEYTWSEGALDASGSLLEGTHTCTVSATDYYGNTSGITLNVTVGPPDVEAPEILFTESEIYVPTGTFYRMVIECVDNYDDVDVVTEWSEGAVDFGGRLSKGTHTLTFTATDYSGNKSVHVVTVYVTDEDPVVGQLVVCGE